MVWKYSFGFKLSNDGKNRIVEAVSKLGYSVLDVGWDYIILDKQLTSTDKTTIRDNLLKILFWEREI